jgi:hypothetical protein
VSLDPRAIATLGVGYGARLVAYLGLWPTGAEPPGPVDPGPPGTAGGGIRRLTRKRSGRTVKREIQTPDGPLIVVVPDDWTADDLMTLTQALLLADALH